MTGKVAYEFSHKTVYTDIVDMPDPLLLNFTARVRNYDRSTRYIQVEMTGPSSWTFTSPINFGSVGSGGSKILNFDRTASRTKPTAETTETIRLRCRSYEDAGYTILLYTHDYDLECVWIKSDDGSWTVLEYSDFDVPATLQGWSGRPNAPALNTGQYVSSPNSAMITHPSGSQIPYIPGIGVHGCQIQKDGTDIIRCGPGYTTQSWANLFPENRWFRFMAPLPVNDTFELRLRIEAGVYNPSPRKQWERYGELYKTITIPVATEAYVVAHMRGNAYTPSYNPTLLSYYDDILIIYR